MCTGSSAVVRGVTAAAAAPGSRFSVTGSMSAKTGVARSKRTLFALATNENGDRKSTRLNSSHANLSYPVLFFNDTATTEIYTLSLHDALPIFEGGQVGGVAEDVHRQQRRRARRDGGGRRAGIEVQRDRVDVGEDRRGALEEDAVRARHERERRSEEHTSELQSRQSLVPRPFF